MPTIPIRQYGDPILREKAKPIETIEERHRALAKDMTETMYFHLGIGLAGNQVGRLERIIVVDVEYARAEEGNKPPQNPTVMINPEIVEESVEDDVYEEGCLSIPGVLGEVWRPVRIKVRFQDLKGRSHERDCEGLFARCIQHEVDHLNGILFPDRMGKLKRKLISGALNQLLQSYEDGAGPG
jgi:peptide deformylase